MPLSTCSPFCAPGLSVLICLLLASASGQAGNEAATEVYTKACASCHGKDGKAKTPAGKKLGVKDLSQSKLADAQIVQQILDGKQDAKGAPTMPGFKDKLTREEIDLLVPLVKEFRK